MVVGFTGTQQGTTEAQRRALSAVLAELRVSVLHHGDCVGADAEAHAIARQLGARVVLHPPINPSRRAWCQADEERRMRLYLERNWEIVRESQVLVATPSSRQEALRSGTWATVRYARRVSRPVALVYPDGSVARERLAAPAPLVIAVPPAASPRPTLAMDVSDFAALEAGLLGEGLLQESPGLAAAIDGAIVAQHVCPACQGALEFVPFFRIVPRVYRAFGACRACNTAFEL